VPLQFYNTLTRQVEPFQPIQPGKVAMYNCGPTVYDYAHIGNFRSFLFADLLRRTLELHGLEVEQVMNITDVGHMTEDQVADGSGEDKMQLAMRRLHEAKKAGTLHTDAVADPNDPYQVADFYIGKFLEHARLLRLKIAGDDPNRRPKATDHVEPMKRLIQSLLDQDHAYIADDGAVYYSVETFPEYGQLSGNTLDKLKGGAGGRVQDEHQAAKRHPADFLLWKPDPTHVMRWPSPWGEGYPGWHIECSAMARAVLQRDVIDIHTGGEDNIFPHHECEIAQSRGATGQPQFARLWMHARFLMVDGAKMSKSKGNFYTVEDLVQPSEGFPHGVDPAALRYELLKAPYRQNANLTKQGLVDSAKTVQRLREARREWEQASGRSFDAIAPAPIDHPLVRRFAEPLGDDLNISGSLGEMHKWLAAGHPDPVDSLAVLKAIDGVLDVVTEPGAPTASDASPETLCAQLDAARAAKDYAEADRLRQELIDQGYEVKTTKDGTVATKKLA